MNKSVCSRAIRSRKRPARIFFAAKQEQARASRVAQRALGTAAGACRDRRGRQQARAHRMGHHEPRRYIPPRRFCDCLTVQSQTVERVFGIGKSDDDVMASGRQTDDRDTPYLCTEFESVNDDWAQISGPPLRPCGFQHRKSKAGQMTASTNCCNVEKVLAMWASSTDAQV